LDVDAAVIDAAALAAAFIGGSPAANSNRSTAFIRVPLAARV